MYDEVVSTRSYGLFRDDLGEEGAIVDIHLMSSSTSIFRLFTRVGSRVVTHG